MKALEEKILKEGTVLPGDILKVDNFLNHQIDVAFAREIGEEFYRLFSEEKVTRILTVESSGIAPAVFTAVCFGDLPVIYAKKSSAANMGSDVYHATSYSYTRQTPYTLTVSKKYLSENDRVLLIDDFLANGEATAALISVCEQAKAEIVGCGIVIEKSYQQGRKRLEEKGIKVHSLARVARMTDDSIEFCEDA